MSLHATPPLMLPLQVFGEGLSSLYQYLVMFDYEQEHFD